MKNKNGLFEKLIKVPRYKELLDGLNEGDLSHNSDHLIRVRNMALTIGKDEKADLEVLEAAALLHDIAQDMEDRGLIEDHAAESARIAGVVLSEVEFPRERIFKVQHCIEVHRKSQNKRQETVEDKILSDADNLDALGFIAVTRTLGSSIQSRRFRRPLFTNEYSAGIARVGESGKNKTAMHYIAYLSEIPKLQPENFHTALGRKYARERYQFLRAFVDEFIKEWRGEA